MLETHYVYLHGFASSPASHKAKFLAHQFQALGLSLTIPDLNQGDFQHLTLTRQLQQLEQMLSSCDTSVSIIGSSFGGLTAAWFADTHPQVKQLVLLAPAFQFLDHWLPTFSTSDLETWKTIGQYPIFHYAEQRELPLHYGFVKDLRNYDIQTLQRSVPTLIIHGVGDETIPLPASKTYAETRDWVELAAVQSDHTLANVLPQIWRSLSDFLQLSATAS